MQTSYLISFLLAWLGITFGFHFLSERDHVKQVQSHLDHLKTLDFQFHSSAENAWGLWSAILDRLNSFSKILGERTRLLKTFSRFVTASVAETALSEELKESGGIARDLTVIMTDIRNFTAMSEKLTPTEVMSLLNEYFNAMLDVISGFQVRVDKFMGDGMLAYVDIEPGPNPQNTKHENKLAIDASLAMLDRVDTLNIKLQQMGLPKIKIGIGVFRGPLVIGLLGSAAKLQYTIIGDTVNRTARLEGLCKELGVSMAISGGIYHSLSLSDQEHFQSFGKQNIKCLAQPMEIFGGPVKGMPLAQSQE